MALECKSFSPSKLQQLRGQSTISVYWRQNESSPSQVVLDAYPRNVAIAFSKKVESHLASATKSRIGHLSGGITKAFTVTGGSATACSQIVKWTLSCCDGKGFKEFPYDPKTTFWMAIKLLEVAEELEIPGLADTLRQRFTVITANLLSLDDANKVCAQYCADSEYGQMVVKNIGTAIFNKQLKIETNCANFCKNYPEYGQKLIIFLEAKEKEKVSQESADPIITPLPKVPKHGGTTNGKNRARRQAMESKEAERLKANEDRAKARRAEENKLWRQQINEARAAQRRNLKDIATDRARQQTLAVQTSLKIPSASKAAPLENLLPPRFSEDSRFYHATNNFFVPKSTSSNDKIASSKTFAAPAAHVSETENKSDQKTETDGTDRSPESKDDADHKVEITFMKPGGTCNILLDSLIVAPLKKNEVEPESEKLNWADEVADSTETGEAKA